MHLEQYLVNCSIQYIIKEHLHLLHWEKQIAKLNNMTKGTILKIITLYNKDNYTLHQACYEQFFSKYFTNTNYYFNLDSCFVDVCTIDIYRDKSKQKTKGTNVHPYRL